MEPPPLLHDELILEILSFLPVKSLVRFKSVSKSWNSTISDSQFIKHHLHRSYSRRNADFPAHFHSLIASPLESSSAIAAATPIPVPDEYSFCGTVDGLICLSEREENLFRIRLWNPATRSMSEPSPPLQDCLDFGFGYDCSSETYKVAAVIRSASGETTVNVYNKGDTCWRGIQVSPLHPTSPMFPAGDAVYVSNTLNWLSFLDTYTVTQQMNSDPVIIFSFDLGKENCAQLLLPYCPRPQQIYAIGHSPILGVLKGCLCYSHTNEQSQIVIWQMKEFGVHNSWTRLFTITTGYESIIVENMFCWSYFAIYMSENGDFLWSEHGVSRSQAVLYIQKDNKFEVTNIASDIVYCYVNNYIESLVSPS